MQSTLVAAIIAQLVSTSLALPQSEGNCGWNLNDYNQGIIAYQQAVANQLAQMQSYGTNWPQSYWGNWQNWQQTIQNYNNNLCSPSCVNSYWDDNEAYNTYVTNLQQAYTNQVAAWNQCLTAYQSNANWNAYATQVQAYMQNMQENLQQMACQANNVYGSQLGWSGFAWSC